MHLPLIDLPKPKCAARPRCAFASMLLGLCVAVLLFVMAVVYYQSHQTPIVYMIDAPLPKASPVKSVTVRIRFMTGIDPHVYIMRCEIPLMELYDELCELEVEAKHHAGTYQGAEKFSFRADEDFAEKYGLTLKQVEEIKREGSRLKQRIGE